MGPMHGLSRVKFRQKELGGGPYRTKTADHGQSRRHGQNGTAAAAGGLHMSAQPLWQCRSILNIFGIKRPTPWAGLLIQQAD